MTIEKCSVCGSNDLFRTRVLDAYLKMGVMSGLMVSNAICISCGYVASYLAPNDLEKLKKWKSKNNK